MSSHCEERDSATKQSKETVKSMLGRIGRATMNCFVALFLAMTAITTANANPTGASVVHGDINISSENKTMTINQATQKGIINWNNFNISADEHTQFVQPGASAITLNRVTGNQASAIQGRLSANGRIILINRNGVMFGDTATVNVGGLIATTADMTNQNFLNENYQFTQPNGYNTRVVNHGMITAADAGLVALVAPGVENSGIITARLGKISLVSSDAFVVDFYGDQLINFSTNGAIDVAPVDEYGNPMHTAVINTGELIADGGVVQVSANAATGVVETVINTQGVIQANSVAQHRGVVYLGGMGGKINVAGIVKAKGKKPKEKGGTITIANDNQGVIFSIPSTITIASGASIDVSGDAGGGTVNIGGSFKGEGPLPNASYVNMAETAEINADAITEGDGGTVILWADDTTNFNGTITARGGAVEGDGGFVETSGKQTLNVTGQVYANAFNGEGGMWWLDPTNIDIDASQVSTIVSTLDGGTNITLNTSSGGGDAGNITTSANITGTGSGAYGFTLFLIADNDITLSNIITLPGVNVDMDAGNDISINANIDTSGPNATGDGVAGTAGGAINLNATNALTIADAVDLTSNGGTGSAATSVNGTGGAGGAAGDITLISSATLTIETNTDINANGAAGGTGGPGNTDTAAGAGGAGGASGSVTITVPTLTINGNIIADAGDGASGGVADDRNGGAGGAGGNAGTFDLNVTNTFTLASGASISIAGGDGGVGTIGGLEGSNGQPGGVGGTGGSGGTLTIDASTISLNDAITLTGGAGNNGGNGLGGSNFNDSGDGANGGAGGAGGSVTLTATGGTITAADTIDTSGGVGGNGGSSGFADDHDSGDGGDGGVGGAGGAHTFNATTLNLTGIFTSTGGTGGTGGASGNAEEMGGLGGVGAAGGAGGAQSFTAVGTLTSTGTFTTSSGSGGAGGRGGGSDGTDGNNAGDGGNGGNGGDAGALTLSGATVTLANSALTTTSGNGGNGGQGGPDNGSATAGDGGDGGDGGTVGQITITGTNALTIPSTATITNTVGSGGAFGPDGTGSGGSNGANGSAGTATIPNFQADTLTTGLTDTDLYYYNTAGSAAPTSFTHTQSGSINNTNFLDISVFDGNSLASTTYTVDGITDFTFSTTDLSNIANVSGLIIDASNDVTVSATVTLPGTDITLDGANAVAVNADIDTSTGSQTFTGATALGTVTLTSSDTVTFNSATTGAGNLTLASTPTLALGDSFSGTPTGTINIVSILDDDASIATGISLVATSGTVNVAAGNYAEDIDLATNITLAPTGNVELTDFDASSSFTLSGTGTIDVGSANMSFDAFTVASSPSLDTTGNITFDGAVSGAGSLGFLNSPTVTLNTNSFNVSRTGAITSVSLASSTTIAEGQSFLGSSGTLFVTGNRTAESTTHTFVPDITYAFSGSARINQFVLGGSNGDDFYITGELTTGSYNTIGANKTLNLTGDTTIINDRNVSGPLTGTAFNIDGTVDGGGNDLTLRLDGPSDINTFVDVASGATLTNFDVLTINNTQSARDVNLRGTTSSINTFTLTGNMNLTLGSTVNATTINGAANDVSVTAVDSGIVAQAIDFTAVSGQLNLAAANYAEDIDLTKNITIDVTGNVELTDFDATSAFTLGGTGTIDVGSSGMSFAALTIEDSPTLDTTGTIVFNGAVTDAGNLTFANIASISLGDTFTGTPSGSIPIVNILDNDASITTGASLVDTAGTLNVTSATYSEAVTIAKALNLVPTGGTVTLTSLITTAAVNIQGTFIGTGNTLRFQAPVTLTGNTNLTDTNGGIFFEDTVNGAFSLILNTGTANLDFDGIVGGVTPLTSFRINGAGNTLSGEINVSGTTLVLGGSAGGTFTGTVNGEVGDVAARLVTLAGSAAGTFSFNSCLVGSKCVPQAEVLSVVGQSNDVEITVDNLAYTNESDGTGGSNTDLFEIEEDHAQNGVDNIEFEDTSVDTPAEVSVPTQTSTQGEISVEPESEITAEPEATPEVIDERITTEGGSMIEEMYSEEEGDETTVTTGDDVPTQESAPTIYDELVPTLEHRGTFDPNTRDFLDIDGSDQRSPAIDSPAPVDPISQKLLRMIEERKKDRRIRQR